MGEEWEICSLLYCGSNAGKYAKHADVRDGAAVGVMPVAAWLPPLGGKSIREHMPLHCRIISMAVWLSPCVRVCRSYADRTVSETVCRLIVLLLF